MTNSLLCEVDSLPTATEQAVGAIWSELLQIDNLKLDDDFFSLGGDSMLMMIVHFRITEELSVALPPAAIAEAPTLRQFSALVDQLSAAETFVE